MIGVMCTDVHVRLCTCMYIVHVYLDEIKITTVGRVYAVCVVQLQYVCNLGTVC